MIAWLITMWLWDTSQTFTNPTFIWDIKTQIEQTQELSLEIESQELSLIIE